VPETALQLDHDRFATVPVLSKGSTGEITLKILLLDVETSPNIATVWGIYDQNIAINQLLESSYLLCYAAKWLDEKEIQWERAYGKRGHYRMGMLRKMHRLLSAADVVIHYNGKRFDMGVLQKEFLLHGFDQPRPYQQLDLYQVVKQKFRFTSSKLDYICQALKLGGKTKHQGHELWLSCMEDDVKAWTMMRRYNVNDVRIMEKLYRRLLPWIKTHPSKSMRKVADMLMGES
jgi:DNA polymerase elongation subunit (family B)